MASATPDMHLDVVANVRFRYQWVATFYAPVPGEPKYVQCVVPGCIVRTGKDSSSLSRTNHLELAHGITWEKAREALERRSAELERHLAHVASPGHSTDRRDSGRPSGTIGVAVGEPQLLPAALLCRPIAAVSAAASPLFTAPAAAAPTPASAPVAGARGTWITDAEWRAMQKLFRPPSKVQFEKPSEFRQKVCNGQLHHLQRADIERIAKYVHSLLTERGHWELAQRLASHGSMVKGLLITEVCKTVGTVLPPVVAAAQQRATRRLTASEIETAAAEAAAAAHMNNNGAAAAAAATSAAAAAPSAVATEPAATAGTGGGVAAVEKTAMPSPAARAVAPATGATATKSTVSPAVAAAAAAVPPPPRPLPSRGASMLATAGSSPLWPISAIIARLPLAGGDRIRTGAVTFDIPPEHRELIATRRGRVLVLASEATNDRRPHFWPVGKDMAVRVNNVPVVSSWRRNWPSRRHPLVKCFLPLDITTMLVLAPGSTAAAPKQRLGVDCFNVEYRGTLLVAIAEPVVNLLPQRDTTGIVQRSYEAIAASSHEDSDLVAEVAQLSIAVKCPVSQSRLVTPVRSVDCKHLQCVEWTALLQTCHSSCCMNCPLCDAPLSLKSIYVDHFVEAALQQCRAEHRFLRLQGTHPPNWQPEAGMRAPRGSHGGRSIGTVSPPVDEDPSPDSENGDGEDRSGAPAASKGRRLEASDSTTTATTPAPTATIGSADTPIEIDD